MPQQSNISAWFVTKSSPSDNTSKSTRTFTLDKSLSSAPMKAALSPSDRLENSPFTRSFIKTSFSLCRKSRGSHPAPLTSAKTTTWALTLAVMSHIALTHNHLWVKMMTTISSKYKSTASTSQMLTRSSAISLLMRTHLTVKPIQNAQPHLRTQLYNKKRRISVRLHSLHSQLPLINPPPRNW